MTNESNNQALLNAVNLSVSYPLPRLWPWSPLQTVKAVDQVNIKVEKNQTLGLVGESGCGKTTLSRALMGIVPVSSGQIYFDGVSYPAKERRQRNLQMVFQDPYASLNPRMTVGEILAEPLRIHGEANGKDLKDKVLSLLDVVGLRSEAYHKYPHQFSGGQRQRIGIARAVALNPKLVIADEPVSALDVSIQSQILNLLQSLRDQFELSYLFISHDLTVIEHVSDVVAVMYLGRIVEYAKSSSLFSDPRHPYTRALLAAVPQQNVVKAKFTNILEGDVPSPANPPAGCHLHPRCPLATARCREEKPQLRHLNSEHQVACHHA